ncbi:MAG TPA: lysylphosphatidylglycerol synthase transmembrane domain-containing protein [Gaiellaceae bacterium]|nr:lysylphosphatidylglycerol synthase transmembrane domain-containing protein [Gaiellaceae bacterium]
MIHSVFHALDVFFTHLASVEWKWLALGVLAQLGKLVAVSRAWTNIVRAAYPHQRVRWRTMFGAYVAGTGVNAIVPARGGDVVRLFLAKRRIETSTYTTLVSTSLLQTLFDVVIAGCFVVWALTQHVLPGIGVLKSPRIPSLDYGWAFRHPTAGLVLVLLLLLFGAALIAWVAERVDEFKAKVAQGFAAVADRNYYVMRVVPWQLLDWTLRLVTVFFFLRAFHIPATVHNALLVQVSQSLATILPISPAGIGTEQGLLLYIFRHVTTKSLALSFSVGMRVTLILVNAIVGFTAILLMTGTLHVRRQAEADRAGSEPAGVKVPDGR